jgi:hypothetical protein
MILEFASRLVWAEETKNANFSIEQNSIADFSLKYMKL